MTSTSGSEHSVSFLAVPRCCRLQWLHCHVISSSICTACHTTAPVLHLYY